MAGMGLPKPSQFYIMAGETKPIRGINQQSGVFAVMRRMA